MDKKRLRQLSKNELIRYLSAERDALISALQQHVILLEEENRLLKATQEKLQAKIASLEHRLKAYENEHTPSSKKRKKNTKKKGNGPRFPGKPKGSRGGGVRLPPPDRTEEHTLESCPSCGHEGLTPAGVKEQHVVDLPEKPMECVLHRVHAYHCDSCGQDVEPAVTLPDGLYGPRLKAASVLLKKEGLSFEKIARFWKRLQPGLSITAPTILHAVDTAGWRLAKTRGAFLRAAKRAKVCHKDETGFRRDGKSGWVWGLFTLKHALYVVDPSRGKHVAERLRGDHISVVDGYQVYRDDPHRARCWEHLRRTAEQCADDFPETVYQVQERFLPLYLKVLKWAKEPPDEQRVADVRFELSDIARCLRSRTGGRGLAVHIENGGEDWLTCLKVLEVPADNNYGERKLRPVVVLRKMMGCFRNDKGKRFIEVVLSVLATWELRGTNTFGRLTLCLT